jgi:propanol-preferring alcohol dehydrogenase
MKAMVLEAIGRPLSLIGRETPAPGPGQVRVKVAACAVCRTNLHVVDGELPHPRLPVIPGHEIIGRIVSISFGG